MKEHLIFSKIQNGNSPDFGDVFSKSIELFKKVWLQGFIHLLLNFVVIIPLIIILYIVLAVAGISFFGTSALLQDEGLAGLTNSLASTTLSVFGVILIILISIIFFVTAFIIQTAIRAHFYKVCKQTDLDEVVSTDYFSFLKKQYVKKLMVLSICYFIIVALASALCFLPLLYVMVPLQFFVVIFAFNPEMKAEEIVRASFIFGNKVWGVTFGLLIISFILSYIAGFLACGIGLYVTLSFILVPLYYVYKDGIGFSNGTENELKPLMV